jgi:hypothetical protein
MTTTTMNKDLEIAKRYVDDIINGRVDIGDYFNVGGCEHYNYEVKHLLSAQPEGNVNDSLKRLLKIFMNFDVHDSESFPGIREFAFAVTHGYLINLYFGNEVQVLGIRTSLDPDKISYWNACIAMQLDIDADIKKRFFLDINNDSIGFTGKYSMEDNQVYMTKDYMRVVKDFVEKNCTNSSEYSSVSELCFISDINHIKETKVEKRESKPESVKTEKVNPSTDTDNLDVHIEKPIKAPVVETSKVINEDPVVEDAVVVEDKKDDRETVGDLIDTYKAFKVKYPGIEKFQDIVNSMGYCAKYENNKFNNNVVEVSVFSIDTNDDGIAVAGDKVSSFVIDPNTIYGNGYNVLVGVDTEGVYKATPLALNKDKNFIKKAIQNKLSDKELDVINTSLPKDCIDNIRRVDMSGVINMGYFAWKKFMKNVHESLANVPKGIRFRIIDMKSEADFKLIVDDQVTSPIVNSKLIRNKRQARYSKSKLFVSYNKKEYMKRFGRSSVIGNMDGSMLDFDPYVEHNESDKDLDK